MLYVAYYIIITYVIRSRIADIRNVGGSGGGGSVTAALFLKVQTSTNSSNYAV